jgi:hypothetical protein
MGFWYIAGVWASPAKAGVESEERGSGYAGWIGICGLDRDWQGLKEIGDRIPDGGFRSVDEDDGWEGLRVGDD